MDQIQADRAITEHGQRQTDMDQTPINHSMTDMDHMDHDKSGMDHGDMDMKSMDMGDMPGMDMHHGHHDMTAMTSATKSMMKDHAAMFRRLFWISVVLAVPTMALDPMFAGLLHYSVPTALPFSLIPALLGTVLYFWPGKPFITGGIDEIKQKKPGMMLLILLGITVAFVSSWLSTLSACCTPHVLVGARPAHRHHARRALDRDGLGGRHHLRARRVRRPAARKRARGGRGRFCRHRGL